MADGAVTLDAAPAAFAVKAVPRAPSSQAEALYADGLRSLNESGLPFLVAGTYAVAAYTGIRRPTKDLDLFCKAGATPRVLDHFRARGFEVEVRDERWLSKVRRDGHFFDVIHSICNGTIPVSDSWFAHACETELFGVPVRLVGPTELIWSKVFIQVRDRFDGADVVHLILRQSERVDWLRLLSSMEQHWEVLLVHLLNFRFIYPSERDLVPAWLLDELLDRLANQRRLPPSQARVCRGQLFSNRDYDVDVREWGFGDLSGRYAGTDPYG